MGVALVTAEVGCWWLARRAYDSGTEVALQMSGQRRTPVTPTNRIPWAIVVPDLRTTADAAHGMANLASTPFAGNVSDDTRAGRAGRSWPPMA